MKSALRSVVILAAIGPFSVEGIVQTSAANLFPNQGFDTFDGDLPTGWSAKTWNQPMMKVKFHRLSPGRDGGGYCLEIEPGTPQTSTSLSSPIFAVAANQDFLFKGYYASTCVGVTTDKRWMNAEGVSLSGNWLDAGKKPVGSFTVVLPDTQDRWIEVFQEVRSPEAARELQIVLTRRWVGGRLRFDDFSLREGKISDYQEEFSIRQVPHEDFFPIFAWLAPHGTQYDTDHHHAQFALANFNLGHKPVFGLKTYRAPPKDDAELSALAKDPMLWWFDGGDEPREEAFPGVARTHERIRRLAPSKPLWVNLLPTYGFASLDDYDRYVKEYIDSVKPTVFTYDHYCLVGNDPHVHANSWYSPHREGDYFPNLEIVRKRALEANAEFGVIVSVGTFAGVRGASEAELRWQTFTTLAYGSRSLGWFCYLTEQNYANMNNWEDMVVNTDGSRTRHYSMLKYLYAEVLTWGPTLLRLKSTGVYHTEPLPAMTRPIKQCRLVASIRGGMCLVGQFKSKDNRSYMMLVNRDFNDPVTLRLKFRQAPDRLLEISKQTGIPQAATGYTRSTGELNVGLAAGDGRLFCLE